MISRRGLLAGIISLIPVGWLGKQKEKTFPFIDFNSSEWRKSYFRLLSEQPKIERVWRFGTPKLWRN